MFDHRNLATEGLYPGLVSTFSIAVLGTLEIEVIIEPVVPSFGGGGVVLPRKDKYKIKIRVKRKDKVWNYESIVSSTTARVIAKLMKVEKKEPEVVLENVTARVKQDTEPQIKVIKK